MHEFFTLGQIDLTGEDERSFSSALRQPKRTALLCYLAIGGPGRFQRRDTLLALLWPEHDDEAGRAALRQAVYYLDEALGRGIIRRRGKEELGVDPACFRCDAAEFERAIAEGRPEEALAWYRGDLLPGFHIAGAPEFMRWLDQTRDRLRQSARRAALQLFDAAEGAGNCTRAGEWAERAMLLAPEDEGIPLRLMTLLSAHGDPAAALGVYDRFVRRLRDEYETAPGPDLTRLADRLRSAVPAPALSRAQRRSRTVPRPGPQRDGQHDAPTGGDGSQFAPPSSPKRVIHRLRRPAVIAGLLILGTSLLFAPLYSPSPSASSLDADLIAVLPFRVTGGDSTLLPLGEGMVDLLALKLGGAEGARAVDGRALFAALRGPAAANAGSPRDSALAVARALGAGDALLGSVIGLGARLTLHALLLDVASGQPRGEARVEGHRDSLALLVDQLAAQVLSVGAEIEGHRIAALTTTSLPALRAYLAGRADFRRGRSAESAMAFQRALDLDSTFALAALGLHYSIGQGPARFAPGLVQRAERIAWANRARLNERDRLRMLARFGASFPAWTPRSDQIAFLEGAVREVRDDPELWYALGNCLFHAGALLGIPDWRERAGGALKRALELDPDFLNPQNHLRQLAVEARDTAAVRRYATMTLARADKGGVRWIVAVVTGDSAALNAMRASRFASFDDLGLSRLAYESQSFGFALDDGALGLDMLRERAASEAELNGVRRLERVFALNAGRPTEAARAMEQVLAGSRGPQRRERLRETVYDALYWGGDTILALNALREIQGSIESRASDSPARTQQLHDVCVSEQWHHSRGEQRTLRRSIATLREASLTTEVDTRRARACAGMLDALLVSAERPGDMPAALARLDSLVVAAIPTWMPEDAWLYAGIMLSARLWARHGDTARALGVVRRRGEPGDAVIMLAPFLREEGRFAAETGDHESAIRAYRHYLVLRSEPEAPLAAAADSVRAELDALLGTAARRP